MSNYDPTYAEMRQVLMDNWGHDPDSWCEVEVAEAIHQYATHYHGGQFTNLYEAITLSGFQPSAYYAGLEDGGVAQMMYGDLCEEFGS